MPLVSESIKLLALARLFGLDGRYGLCLLLSCLLLLLPELAGDAARSAMRYERSELLAGEWWRLLSAHLVHLDMHHTVLNILGFILMWALFVRDYRPLQWLIIALAGVLAIDLGLWQLDPDIGWYVGSSGLLHAVIAAGTLAHLRRREADGWILAAFLVGKLAWEQSSGSLPLAGADASVIVNAHLYGALGGLLASAFLKPCPKSPLPSRNPDPHLA